MPLLKMFLFLVALSSFQRMPRAACCHAAAFAPGQPAEGFPRRARVPRCRAYPSPPLRRPQYCCQMILTVCAAGDSLSLWNELFHGCQLVREISLKAEPESSPGSDQLKVEARHHRAKGRGECLAGECEHCFIRGLQKNQLGLNREPGLIFKACKYPNHDVLIKSGVFPLGLVFEGYSSLFDCCACKDLAWSGTLRAAWLPHEECAFLLLPAL